MMSGAGGAAKLALAALAATMGYRLSSKDVTDIAETLQGRDFDDIEAARGAIITWASATGRSPKVTS